MNIKKLFTKATAWVCMSGVVLVSNAPLVQAYEAHVMNVTANIIDNSVTINPTGGRFCNDGKLKVEISTKLAGAEIYYTTNGSDPVCQTNGSLYAESFTLLSGKTVKAVSCANGKQSQVVSQVFDVSASYCETSLKINKVYYNPDRAHQAGSCNNENEWVEIYNPTKEAVNLKNWKICDEGACDTLSSKDLMLGAKGYAVVTYGNSTWGYWNVPSSVIKITLGNAIGNGLNNSADMLVLKNASGQVVDQMNWGAAATGWANYNSQIWSPALAVIGEGKIFGRESNGYDTDRPCDWQSLALPAVSVDYPNGGETWTVGETYTIKWSAVNNNGVNSNLSIDLYYSNDSGQTWASVVKNTENDGAFAWRVPLDLKYPNGNTCLTPSRQARIKAVATDYTRNFMLSNSDISDQDFCPPIDKSLLTAEELALLSTLDTTGFTFVDSEKAAAPTGNEVAKAATDTDTDTEQGASTEIKPSSILNKEEDEYQIAGESAEDKDQDSDTDTDIEENVVATAEKTATVAVTPDFAPENADQEENTDTSAAVTEEKKEAEAPVGVPAEVSKGSNVEVAPVSAESEAPISTDGNVTIEFNLNS